MSNALTNKWNEFMRKYKNPTKKQIYQFRDAIEKKYFGNKYDTPKK